MIQFLLGEEISTDFYDIKNIKEAISLLNTEMNSIAVKYLSEHFLELFESGETKHLNEDVIFSVIDLYNESENANQKKTENKQIFELLKNQEEPEIVIHFIIGQKGEFIKEAIEYVMENLDDEIVAHELPRVTLFIKELLKFNDIEKVTVDKSQVTEVKFNGNELSGIISYLKKKHGDDLEGSGVLKLTGAFI